MDSNKSMAQNVFVHKVILITDRPCIFACKYTGSTTVNRTNLYHKLYTTIIPVLTLVALSVTFFDGYMCLKTKGTEIKTICATATLCME